MILFVAALIGVVPSTGKQESLPRRERIRENVREILSSAEYDTGEGKKKGFDPIEWILRKIQELLASIADLGARSPALYWIALAVCAILLGVILGYAGRGLFRTLRAARSREPAASKGSRPDDPHALLRNAEEAAARGRFTEAIRLCHRAALLGMDRRRIVRFQESLTTGDYRRQLASHPRERGGYESLARIFEPAFFGKAPTGAAEFQTCRRTALELAQDSGP